MKPYPRLTETGKVRRLREVAEHAIARYPIRLEGLRFVGRGSNTTFRVDTASEAYALRIGPASSPLHTPTELAWLERLAKDERISAAVPVRNSDNKLVTTVTGNGVHGERTCVLFEWLPGNPVGEQATELDYALLGEVAAHLHDNAAGWRRRKGLHPLVWDRVFYYPNEPAVLYDGRFRKLMTEDRTEIIRELERKATKELKRIHRELPLMMLHGDLHPGNIHLHRGKPQVFDFEEVMWGAPVQDIAITLWRARGHPKYEDLREALVEGYETVREWPANRSGQLDLLMAARSLMILNYALRKGVATETLVATVVAEFAGALDG